MKRLIVLLTAIFALSLSIAAQNETPKTINGGVLNGKAVSLPKPSYPPAARAVRAEGAVSVQVLIEEDGSVISATAVSGHPLLRAAAVQAAQGAKFSPTMLSGIPVKVSGIITYNFVGPLSPGMFGFELGYAERAGKFTETAPASLAARLPNDWSAERETLQNLSFETPPEPAKPAEPAVNNQGNVLTISRASVAPAYRTGQKLTAESLQALRQLQAVSESRLSSSPVSRWFFNVGRTLGYLVAEKDDPNKLSANVSELEQLKAAMPAEVPHAMGERLNALLERARAAETEAVKRTAVIEAADTLRSYLGFSQW